MDGSKLRVGIVAARFNEAVANALLRDAERELQRQSVKKENVVVVRVAGSVEIPLALQILAEQKHFDCLVSLGVIIRGETPHFDYVAKIASEGVLRVMLDYTIPVGFGVLTTENEAQAKQRVSAGRHAVRAALELASLKKQFRSRR